MRLSSAQVEAIKQETEHFFGAKAEAWLFGSRVDNTAKDGACSGRSTLKTLLRVINMDNYLKQGAATQRGFTLIELISVMVIVGILAVFAAPRMFNANAFQSRGFSDQVQATLRYAQKIAIAQRRNVCVAMTTTSVSLTIATVAGAASACVNPLPLPQGGNSITTPVSTITLTSSSANFIFNGLGSTTAQTISVLGEANAIIVEAETGYVHSP